MRLIKNFIDDTCTVCVSGGCDSVAALHVLYKKYNVSSVYHFNHGTLQSSNMQRGVENLCEDLKLKLIVEKTDKPLKSEDDFRKARFKYINETKGKYITAHTLDDAVESHCLRFFTGTDHYLPIPLHTDLENGGMILHPFLLVEKTELRRYVSRNNLEQYVTEDTSNYDSNSSRRTWVRMEFLDILKSKNIFLKKIVKKRIISKL